MRLNRYSRMLEVECYCILPKSLVPSRLWLGQQNLGLLNKFPPNFPQNNRYTSIICSISHRPSWKSTTSSFRTPVSLNCVPSLLSEGDQGSNDDVVSEVETENVLPPKLGTDELKSMLLDLDRSRLLRKLSEANQYNRFLKRQLQIKDDALFSLINELSVLEFESKALVTIVKEVASTGMQLDSRNIDGKCLQSHLLSRLQALHERVKERILNAGSQKFEEITLLWVGMAESVRVMGSFDGWSQGEEMSGEYSGDYAKFSATLKLRPGRYELKFLVDGEWLLSPELPSIGEGLLKNNLLIVE
ncbi:hypothetical protein KSP39_PZI024262 [Platanthera zijinensis]|uniref:AMP-activated protein kinase glycogen-binding domain-containing protein n=1 Tax=Platanthera zijinensis TaxID=2320716 RepID=A0AAP0FU02_9ASPA